MLLAAASSGRVQGGQPFVAFVPTPAGLPLVHEGTAAPLWLDAHDWPGVIRAAGDLQTDMERVSGVRPALATSPAAPGRVAVIIGTVGHSALIDRLARSGKLDVAAIRGRWEAFLHEVVENPLPGVERALVIAGSDKRGTIYGIYDLSEQIGVSPWYWWADVPDPAARPSWRWRPAPEVHRARRREIPRHLPQRRGAGPDQLGAGEVRRRRAQPRIRRSRRASPTTAMNSTRGVFELMLRLRANYLWPAMWNNAFNEDDPANAAAGGRIRHRHGHVAPGTDAAGAEGMGPPLPEDARELELRHASRRAAGFLAGGHPPQPGLREHHHASACAGRTTRRWRRAGRRPTARCSRRSCGSSGDILDGRNTTGRRARCRRLWCLYKEVQDFYEAGMRVPEDVTLLWCDDNWGNLRRLPTADERRRPGGAGVYYHFDYHGGPRSYQWINANPLPKIWDQMTLAHQYGADRIWIVNVGHFKGYELPLEFFLDLAWNPDRWTADQLDEYTRMWAAQQFGPEHARDIAAVLDGYAKANGRRKPETARARHLQPGQLPRGRRPWSRTSGTWRRGRRRSAGNCRRTRATPSTNSCSFPPGPARCSTSCISPPAGTRSTRARAGRARTTWRRKPGSRFQDFTDLMAYFNRAFAGGKWDHFMDQPVARLHQLARSAAQQPAGNPAD